MQGLEREMGEPVSNVQLGKLRTTIMKSMHSTKTKLMTILFHQGFLLVFIGFLLGRALILNELTPFALPFFASVYFMKKNRAGLTLLALMIGSTEPGWFRRIGTSEMVMPSRST
jgi:stage II sporulation protein E